MFKEFRRDMVVSTIIYIIIGVILIIWPDKTAKIVNYIIAAAMAAGGIANIFRYLKMDLVRGAKSFSLSIGIVMLAAAVFLFVEPTVVVSIFPVLLGIIIFVSGVIKFQNAVDVARTGYKKWGFIMLMALLCIAFGVAILINPFRSAKMLIRLIGISFVYSGLSDLLATFFLNGKIKEFEKDLKNIDIIDVDDIK